MEQNFRFGILDLDRIPWTHATIADNGPVERMGPRLDHGFEDGVGPMPLVECKVDGPIDSSHTQKTYLKRGNAYYFFSPNARAEESEEDQCPSMVKETMALL